MNAKQYLLDDRVLFDSVKMTLSQEEKIVRLSESECHLLLAFRQGIYKKEEIIHFVWQSRGGCVSESSYYKLINQLRNSFCSVGLQASDIVTRPRVGISLSVSIVPVAQEEEESATESRPDTEPISLSPASREISHKTRQYVLLAGGMALLGLLLVALCFFTTALRQQTDKVFTPLGRFDDYSFYKMQGDKITFDEVITAYTTITLKIYRQNGGYLYYIREPDNNIFFQCLNPVETAVPKCLTIKERY